MSAEPVRHRFTVEDYYRMGEAGMFGPDQRLELLGGEVIEMSPIGSRHQGMVDHLNQLFMRVALDQRATIRVQGPVRLGDVSELQPDFTVLRWRADFYRSGHPTPGDVLLLIEVSDSTASWDRRVERPFYAAAGIIETWIVDLGRQVVEVATDPATDEYRQVHTVAPGGSIAPLALPELTIDVADLFG